MALYAIGDVHGCARSLEALLARINPVPEDHLVFVGDYVDRGPRSREVIEMLVDAQKASTDGRGPACTFLRGNHDQMMLDWLDRGEFELWGHNGAMATLGSYSGSAGRHGIPEEHIAFLRATRIYFDTPDYFFVHAGLNPDLTIAQNLEFETPRTFLWSRGHYGTKRRWEKPVVCGHTPHADVVIEDDMINVDTGCCFPHLAGLGKLSAIRLPDREVIQVENVDV